MGLESAISCVRLIIIEFGTPSTLWAALFSGKIGEYFKVYG